MLLINLCSKMNKVNKIQVVCTIRIHYAWKPFQVNVPIFGQLNKQELIMI